MGRARAPLAATSIDSQLDIVPQRRPVRPDPMERICAEPHATVRIVRPGCPEEATIPFLNHVAQAVCSRFAYPPGGN
jgi:hypothetical protein